MTEKIKMQVEQKDDAHGRHQITPDLAIYKRGRRDTWTADFHYVDEGGRRQHGRRSLKTRNLRVAMQKARELADQLDRGELASAVTKAEPVTLEDAVDDFVRSKETEGKAPKTLMKYRQELRLFKQFLREHKGATTLQAVTAQQCDAYTAWRKKHDQLDDYTLYNVLVVLKTFMRWCETRNLITASPLAKVRLCKPRRRKHPAATQQQLEAVLSVATGTLFAVFAMLGFTGLRIGEVIALRPEDVDLVGRVIRVHHRENWRPKTEGSEREVPIHPRLLAILRAMPNLRKPFYFTAAPSQQFPEGNHHVNPRDINELFITLAAKCGFPVGRDQQGLTLHALRRFFKTFCLDAGVPAAMVNYWLGHVDQNSMDFHYYDPQKSKEWMDRVPFGEPNEHDLKRVKGVKANA
jgi:integrase